MAWERAAAEFSADHRVIALDHRGHGDSEWASPEQYRPRDFVFDVEVLVTHLGLDAFVLAGHGAGGRNALVYAVAHPEKVDALVVVDSDLEAAAPESQGPPSGQMGDSVSLEALVGHLRAQQPGSTEETLRRQATCLSRELPGGKRALKRDPAALAEYDRQDLWDEWRRLRCPVLLVRGRQSHVLAHEAAVRMREAVATVRLAELEGSGHGLHLELPGTFVRTVRWFLDAPPT